MNRDRYNTVTGFVILIPASESEAMGEALFFPGLCGPSYVRAIALEEIKKTARKLRGSEGKLFGALLALRGAFENRDSLALERAKTLVEEVYRLQDIELGPEKQRDTEVLEAWARPFAASLGLSLRETARYLEGRRPSPKITEDLRRLFSYEVTRAVSRPGDPSVGTLRSVGKEPRLVLWWFEGEFRPAIHCPDVKTALYIHTFFLAPTGAVGFRICPYDGEQFFQDRPNQEYCCPAHREAHRVARFRDNQRRKAEKRAKEEKRHGTQKTR